MVAMIPLSQNSVYGANMSSEKQQNATFRFHFRYNILVEKSSGDEKFSLAVNFATIFAAITAAFTGTATFWIPS